MGRESERLEIMRTTGRIPPTHPGDVLREEYLKPLDLTPHRLAQSLGMTETAVREILDCRRDITANAALRIARFFGGRPEIWMGLQANYDLEIEKDRFAEEIAKIKPFERAI